MFEKFDCEQVKELVEKGLDLKSIDAKFVDVRVTKDNAFSPRSTITLPSF